MCTSMFYLFHSTLAVLINDLDDLVIGCARKRNRRASHIFYRTISFYWHVISKCKPIAHSPILFFCRPSFPSLASATARTLLLLVWINRHVDNYRTLLNRLLSPLQKHNADFNFDAECVCVCPFYPRFCFLWITHFHVPIDSCMLYSVCVFLPLPLLLLLLESPPPPPPLPLFVCSFCLMCFITFLLGYSHYYNLNHM